MKKYDICIIGMGPGGLFAAYKLIEQKSELKIAIFDKGKKFNDRHCPLADGKVDKCINCKTCAIMEGPGGAGAFSDSKYNITNDFGGTIWQKIGKQQSLYLQKEVDDINMSFLEGEEKPKLYTSANTKYKKLCLENDLHLLNADIRHLGTDKGQKIISRMVSYLETKMDFYYETNINNIEKKENYILNKEYECDKLLISAGRSGSKWLEGICDSLEIGRKANKVDLGVRVELPYEVFSHLTEELYESKIIYRTKSYNDLVRTFCMNPHGIVVNENTNGIMTVNGHSYEDKSKHTENTNFALLVSQQFTEPFNNSNEYGESIARLSNMLGGGVIVQRFGDLIRYRRSTTSRLSMNTVIPTLKATPGDLSLAIPHRFLEDIKEMIYALDKIAPGTANEDTLLYGCEIKFYDSFVNTDNNFEALPGLFIFGDCSGSCHSLSQAAASGLYVGYYLTNKDKE